MTIYQPNFQTDCRECGRIPTVVVVDHICPETQLCGVHFFNSLWAIDWESWNDPPEGTE